MVCESQGPSDCLHWTMHLALMFLMQVYMGIELKKHFEYKTGRTTYNFNFQQEDKHMIAFLNKAPACCQIIRLGPLKWPLSVQPDKESL